MQAEGNALVTGASRGLGRAVAVELARRGFQVFAGMRDPRAGEGLADEAGASIQVVRLDVESLADFAMPETLRALVNNAGTETDYLPVEHATAQQWRDVFETNVFGLAELTRRALPSLRRGGAGGVVCNVTSASLLFPMPFYSVYRASKAAVAALGESLRAELHPLGLRVLEVMPGPIDTDMLAGSHRRPEAERHEGYQALAEWAWQGRQASEAMKTPAPEAAARIVDAILDPAAPLRIACDPMGAAMIPAADAPFEARLQGALLAMNPPSGPEEPS